MRIAVKPVFLVCLLVLALTHAPSGAPRTNPPGIGFAMIGLATGQTARLNALNLAALDPSNPSSCSATLQFLDTQSNVLKQSAVNLSPGNAASLDLSDSELQTSATRSEIRAVALIGYAGGANPPGRILQTTACDVLVPSVEIFNNTTGATSLILTSYRQLPQPATAAQ